jgi:hypothetical protein
MVPDKVHFVGSIALDSVEDVLRTPGSTLGGRLRASTIVEPLDASKLVEVANALTAAPSRPVTYIHMPVPIDRGDEAYFQLLKNLRLSPRIELYLSVVHADGAEPTDASPLPPDFGIATECGIARCRTPEIVKDLLRVYAGTSREPIFRAELAKK